MIIKVKDQFAYFLMPKTKVPALYNVKDQHDSLLENKSAYNISDFRDVKKKNHVDGAIFFCKNLVKIKRKNILLVPKKLRPFKFNP